MKIRSSAELKAMAKKRMAPKITSLVGATLIYGAILVALAFAVSIVYSSSILAKGNFESEEALFNYLMEEMYKTPSGMELLYTYGIEIIISAIIATLSVGLSYVCLKAARKEEIKAKDIFKVYQMNPDRIIIIYLAGFFVKFLFTLPEMLLTYVAGGETGELSIVTAVAFLLQILGIMCQVVVTVFFSQANFIYLDKPEQNSFLSIKESFLYMKKYFASYLYLYVSFIPWYLVIAVTCGIAAIWVLPYQNITYALYYMEIKGENSPRFDQAV